MTRSHEPLITPTKHLNAEGRSRIAFFVGVMREQPNLMAGLLRGLTTCEHAVKTANALDVQPEEATFDDRAIKAAGAMFENGDDLYVTVDAETRSAIAQAKAGNTEQGSPLDPRIVAAATVAGQFASYEFYLEYSGVQPSQAPAATAQVVPLQPFAHQIA